MMDMIILMAIRNYLTEILITEELAMVKMESVMFMDRRKMGLITQVVT
jgi:hypothetical protein